MRRLEVSGHRPHNIRDNPLPCQKKAVILQSHSEMHRTFIARSSRYHRTHVQVQPRSGVPVALKRAFQKPAAVPFALRAVQKFQEAEACSICPAGGPEACGCSKSPSGVPRADNRTEIISPANKQYKGRKGLAVLRASQALKRAFQEPCGRSKRQEAVPVALKRVPVACGCSKGSRWFQSHCSLILFV